MRQTDVDPMVVAVRCTDENPKAESAHSCRQRPIKNKGCIEDLPITEEVLNIFRGPCEAGSSHHARDRYAKEVRRPPQALVHKTEVPPTRGIMREPTYIVFMEEDAKWVHHRHIDTLIITIKIANNIIHRMLVDNGSAANILFWGTYQKTGLAKADFSPVTSPLYGFIWDHMIPKGTIKLAVTLGEHPQVSTMVIEFHVVDCPSAFNRVIGRPLLRILKAVTSIHCLTLKFPTAVGTG